MTADVIASRPKTQASVTGGGSALRRYQEVVVGRAGLAATLYFEFCAWLSPVPGALGLALRKTFWPRLFGSCGEGVLFGAGTILRHPHRIHLGDRVVVSEGCVLDARSAEHERAITVGDDVILSNGVILSCKGARIAIGARTGLGPQAMVLAGDGGDVTIGADCALGPRVTLVGGGHYRTGRTDMPIWRQGIRPGDALTLEDDLWFGAGVIGIGGVRVGTGTIAAAGAVLAKDVEPLTVAGGVPAKAIRYRGSSSAERGSRQETGSSSAERGSRQETGSSSAERGSPQESGSSGAERGSRQETGSSSAERGSPQESGPSSTKRGSRQETGSGSAKRGSRQETGSGSAKRGSRQETGSSSAERASRLKTSAQPDSCPRTGSTGSSRAKPDSQAQQGEQR